MKRRVADPRHARPRPDDLVELRAAGRGLAPDLFDRAVMQDQNRSAAPCAGSTARSMLPVPAGPMDASRYRPGLWQLSNSGASQHRTAAPGPSAELFQEVR